MKKLKLSLILFVLTVLMAPIAMAEEKKTDLYSIPLVTIEGESTSLAAHKDKALLIVNTASKCGLTKQYKGLEALWKEYGDKGLVVLGFPCNQFGGQEPAGEKEIAAFCEKNFGVSFPMFSKLEVNGKNSHPLYAMLKKKAPGIGGTESIKWNFTKFLVEPGAKKITRFSPRAKPESLKEEIEAALPKK